jgi:Bacterial Ig domain
MSFVDQPVSPWGAYQGEAWTLLTYSPSVIALWVPDGVVPLDQRAPAGAVDLPTEAYTLPSGDAIYFLAQYALRPVQSLFLGRSVSEGVMTANPYSGARNRGSATSGVGSGVLGAQSNAGFTTPGKTLIDGVDLKTISNLSSSTDALDSSHLFWTAPSREPSSTAVEIIEVRFLAPQKMNILNFDTVHFPHTVQVQYWDTGRGKWIPIFSSTIRDSIPFSINGALPSGALHPAHFGEHHWITIKQAVDTITTDTLRFVFRRDVTGTSPFGVDGKPTQYPLGVRNVDLGYRITSIGGIVPSNDPAVPIATTVNAVGQPIQQFVYRYPAGNALQDDDSFWKSQPQPVGEAVVNYYLDMRPAIGDAPVVDHFYIEPLTTGPSFNIYWSAGAATTDLSIASPQDSDLIPDSIRGSINVITSGDQGLAWDASAPGWVDFSNSLLQLDPPNQAWWLGASVFALKPSNTITEGVVLSMGGTTPVGDVAISFDVNVVRATWQGTIIDCPAIFNTNDRIDILVAFTPDNTGVWMGINIFVSIEDGPVTTSSGRGVRPGLTRPPVLRVGHTASSDTTGGAFPFRMVGLNLHYGSGVPQVNTYFSDPSLYRKIPLESDRIKTIQTGVLYDQTFGSLIRLDPSFVRPGYTLGFVGGQPDIYGTLKWSPVARDYTLRKGYLKVPPVAAGIWKFEFSGLVPEPYETFLSIPRRVKLFPSSAQVSSSDGVSWSEETITAMTLASQGRFKDTAPIITYTTPYLYSVPPTTGVVAPDIQSAGELANRRGFPYNTMAWQPPSLISQFVQAGTHEYNVVEIVHTNRAGFFVGLRRIVPFRVDYSAPENTTTYIDYFWDLANIASPAARTPVNEALGKAVAVITAPVSGSNSRLGLNLTISGTATSPNSGVSSVKIYDNGVLVRTISVGPFATWSWVTPTGAGLFDRGYHLITATATDLEGGEGPPSSGVIIYVAEAPVALISSPSSGSGSPSGSLVTITGLASSNNPSGVTAVNIYDNAVLIQSLVSGPFGSWSWGTASLSGGSHFFQSSAIDNQYGEGALSVGVSYTVSPAVAAGARIPIVLGGISTGLSSVRTATGRLTFSTSGKSITSNIGKTASTTARLAIAVSTKGTSSSNILRQQRR